MSFVCDRIYMSVRTFSFCSRRMCREHGVYSRQQDLSAMRHLYQHTCCMAHPSILVSISLKFKCFHTRRIHVLGDDARLHLALLCHRRARCAWRAWRAALIPRLKHFSAERCKNSLYASIYASIYAMMLWSTASSQNLGGGIQSGVHCTGDLLRESRTVSVKCNGIRASHRQRRRGRTNRKGGYKG